MTWKNRLPSLSIYTRAHPAGIPNYSELVMTKAALESFLDKLEQFMRDKGLQDTRPFVCDGDPTLCSVFIVGFNPANSLPVDSEILNKKTGFNLELFYNKYSADRAQRAAARTRERQKSGDKPTKAPSETEFAGLLYKRHINPISPCKLGRTRASLETLAAAIENELVGRDRPKVLETNIHWLATPDMREFRKKYGYGDKGAGLRFLIDELKPLVILCHGKDTEQFFRADENRDLTAHRALVVIGQDGAWPKCKVKPRYSHLCFFPRTRKEYVDAVVSEVINSHEA